VGAPHRAVQGGLQEVLIWPWWVSDTFCGSMFYVFCMGTGCFKNLGSGVPAPLSGAGYTQKLLCLVILSHPAKFSSSSYNGWTLEIVGTKNFGCWGELYLWPI